MTDQRPITPIALDVKDAASYIGMSVSWLEHSDVPRVRLGRRVKYLVEDLDRYLKQHRTHDVPVP